uniref:Uncharacterized protein n=1 Tax=Rhizophora mucronata TaxID=61149 RepID=A0A2P2P8N9_RHIMU
MYCRLEKWGSGHQSF